MSDEKGFDSLAIDKESVEFLSRAGKYLTFELEQEVYGIEILKVQEIIGIMKVTNIPKTPDFVRGVINLRGKVIPVIDLRVKFELSSQEDTERTCIIVVQIFSENGVVIVGSIVDEVKEVMDLKEEQIEDAPAFGESGNMEFIMGMAKTSEKVVMLLDVDKVLSGDEIGKLSHMSGKE